MEASSSSRSRTLHRVDGTHRSVAENRGAANEPPPDQPIMEAHPRPSAGRTRSVAQWSRKFESLERRLAFTTWPCSKYLVKRADAKGIGSRRLPDAAAEVEGGAGAQAVLEACLK